MYGSQRQQQSKRKSLPISTHRPLLSTLPLGSVLYPLGPHGHVCGHPTQQSSSNLAPNQDNRQAQEAGPLEEVHESRFVGHVGRHPGYLEMGGQCRFWLDIYLGTTRPSLHGDKVCMWPGQKLPLPSSKGSAGIQILGTY